MRGRKLVPVCGHHISVWESPPQPRPAERRAEIANALRALSNYVVSPDAACDSDRALLARAKGGDLVIPRPLTALCQAFARTLCIILGCAATAWAIKTLPVSARQAPIERVAAHVIAGDQFKPGVLLALLPQLETAERREVCQPTILRSAAIIRTRIAEQAIVDDQDIDAQLSTLSGSIRRALACSPTDSFLWVVFYWVESTRNGLQSRYVDYLRLSYQLGPNEGWIALKRNGYAFAIFSQLPPDLKELAITEFASLLDSGFVDQTVAIFTGPGWSERNVILPRLKDVAERPKQAFATAVYKLGYDVNVPGTAHRDPRPWD